MDRPLPADLEIWSRKHWLTAEKLAAEDDPWAAVAAFYSVYPLLRAALIQDDIFSDMRRLKSINPNLMTDDRYIKKHDAGPRNKTAFGLNQLCTAMYLHATAEYHYCHKASIQVRYESGLRFPYSIPTVMNRAEAFRKEYIAGNLVQAVSCTLSSTS